MTRSAKDVADEAFDHFRAGLETGNWQSFLAMLSDDFTFWFPMGAFAGEHRGREAAERFFEHVRSTFPGGIRITEMLSRPGSEPRPGDSSTFVYEFRDEGTLRGEPYYNRVAVALDVRNGEITGYREYFGSDGKSN